VLCAISVVLFSIGANRSIESHRVGQPFLVLGSVCLITGMISVVSLAVYECVYQDYTPYIYLVQQDAYVDEYLAAASQRVASVSKPKRRHTHGDNKLTEKDRGQSACVVCLDNKISVILSPCQHAILCWRCAKTTTVCPACSTVPTRRDVLYYG
jgi:hypothetical protein